MTNGRKYDRADEWRHPLNEPPSHLTDAHLLGAFGVCLLALLSLLAGLYAGWW